MRFWKKKLPVPLDFLLRFLEAAEFTSFKASSKLETLGVLGLETGVSCDSFGSFCLESSCFEDFDFVALVSLSSDESALDFLAVSEAGISRFLAALAAS